MDGEKSQNAGAETAASALLKQQRRQIGRPFKPGQSGNPAGRQKGQRNKATVIAEQLLDGEAEELVRKAIELAKLGDGPVLRACLDRLLPPRKDVPIAIQLPPIRTAADAVNASAAVLAAVAAGEVTPDEANRVMGLLTAHRTIIETADLEERIAKLENDR